MKINSIILSAGKGTRMKSEKPKVIQKILGYEMINLVLKHLNDANIENNILVLGYKREEIIKVIDGYKYDYVVQEEQLGTGHAVKICKDRLKNEDGITIITCGDTPLIRAETYKQLIQKHNKQKNKMTILTAIVENPTGYGRIIRNEVGLVSAIVEEKDASEKVKMINEINGGIYCFDNKTLFKYIDQIENNNAQNEYYLTDLVKIFNDNNEVVSTYVLKDNKEIVGVNDLNYLEKATTILKNRIFEELSSQGVVIMDRNNTYIGPKVKIGKETIIYPNNVIFGDVIIGEKNILKSGNNIFDSTIGNNNEIGPMTHIRNNSKICDNCRVGNFVEIKNSILDDNTKCAHLTYIGDSEIGKNVNVGCGVITANYDGKNKYKTKIGNNCFIGSNSTLIAPIEIKDNVFIAAGSTISLDEIDEKKLVIARAREVIKERGNYEY